MRDLSKIIGKDIKQAERFAEAIDASAERLRNEITALEETKLILEEQLAQKTGDAAEAWEYVEHLKKIN